METEMRRFSTQQVLNVNTAVTFLMVPSVWASVRDVASLNMRHICGAYGAEDFWWIVCAQILTFVRPVCISEIFALVVMMSIHMGVVNLAEWVEKNAVRIADIT